MCKVNEVWFGVRQLCSNAEFLCWFDPLEQLEFWDPGSGCVKIARMVIREDGSKEVETI